MRILVVGAGLAGLAAYRALTRRGFEVSLVERELTAGRGGAGIYLPGNSVRAIAELGLLDALMAVSHPITHQHFCDEAGRLLSSVDTRVFWKGVAPCRSLSRSALWNLLRDGLGEGAIAYRSVLYIGRAGNRCQVCFADGSIGEYDLVIGADGVNSTVRCLAFNDAPEPEYVGNLCWRFIAPNICGLDSWTVMLGTDRTLLGKPVSPAEIYIYADLAVKAGRVRDFSASTPLRPLFEGIAGPLRQIFDQPAAARPHFAPVMRLRMPHWYRGQVVLVGDAAHAGPPSMAQGAGLAIEDALVLAEELAAGDGISTALKRYEARRRPRADWVHRQNAARDMMRRLPRAIRNGLFRSAGERLYARAYTPLTEPI